MHTEFENGKAGLKRTREDRLNLRHSELPAPPLGQISATKPRNFTDHHRPSLCPVFSIAH